MIKKILKTTFWIALAFIFCWTLYFLYGKSQPTPEVVQTGTPYKISIIKKTVATGSVIPRKEILIKSQVSGIVEKLFVTAGQMIKQGDVIAKIKIIPNMLNLNNAENRLSVAKINFDGVKVEFDRTEELYKQGVVAKAEFQQSEIRLNTAKEELAAAQSNLDLIKDGVTKNAGNATNTLVRSTISGMILDIPAKEGNSVIESNTFNEGTTIAAIANMGEMIFEGKLDESEVGKIKEGMELILTVGAVETEKFKAKLEYISPKGVSENGAIQFQIKAKVDMNSTNFLRAGYSANADIILDKRDSVLAIQESWMKFEGKESFVEIEKTPGTFEKRMLKTGLSDGINIEILEGLKGTEKIKMPQMAAPAGMPEY